MTTKLLATNLYFSGKTEIEANFSLIENSMHDWYQTVYCTNYHLNILSYDPGFYRKLLTSLNIVLIKPQDNVWWIFCNIHELNWPISVQNAQTWAQTAVYTKISTQTHVTFLSKIRYRQYQKLLGFYQQLQELVNSAAENNFETFCEAFDFDFDLRKWSHWNLNIT